MTHRHFGLLSMVLFAAAVGVALYVVARASWWAAGGFAVLNLLSLVGVSYSYCAKCTCRHRCCHYFIGPIAGKLFTPRAGGYTAGDYLLMLASAGMVFAYPLPWLWTAPWALWSFFGIGALATLCMLFAVCPSCGNAHCPSARWTVKGKTQTKV
jgi:hypothetical protein